MKIFILAGGFGTRLQSVVNDVPKPMAPIHNKPFLDYQIEELRQCFPDTEIYLLTYYKSNIIEAYYKNKKNINIIKENKVLGTGGCILNAIKKLRLVETEKLLILNGDTYIKTNLEKMINNAIYDLTILSSFQEDCSRYGSLEIKNDILIKFKEKIKNCRESYINAGCYYFANLDFFREKRMLKEVFSLEESFIEYLEKEKIGVSKYYDIFIDIGIPSDYEKMKNYISDNYGKK